MSSSKCPSVWQNASYQPKGSTPSKIDFGLKMLEPHTYTVSNNQSANDMPNLIKSFSHWICLSESQISEITDLALKLQSTFILTDDIESGAETRNGAPLSTAVFGVSFTLNSINMLYVDVCQTILRLFPGQELEYTGIFAEGMQNIIEEVGKEVTLWETATYPTEEEYLEIIKKRNGGLLKLLVDLMQRLGKDKQDFGSLIDSLSAYLVISKDLTVLTSFLNDNSTDYQTERASFPIVHAIESDPNDTTFLRFFKHGKANAASAKLVNNRLEKTNTLLYTRCKLTELLGQVKQKMATFGDNPYMGTFVDNLEAKLKAIC